MFVNMFDGDDVVLVDDGVVRGCLDIGIDLVCGIWSDRKFMDSGREWERKKRREGEQSWYSRTVANV